jgi:hypothetical protein
MKKTPIISGSTLTKVGLLLFFVSIFSQSVSAQSASINGFVSDKSSGEPLLFVNVAIAGTPRGAATNESGFYKISDIDAGEVEILCSYIGFKTFRKKVNLLAGESLRLDIELIPDGLVLEEVVIEADAEKEERANIGVASVPTALIKSLPSVFEADVFRSVQLLPGVKSSSDFSAGLFIRGGSPDQTLIMLDRTVVYNPTHFFGFFSTFNPDAIKDVRLFKGGFPAEYGGRLGSVLDIYNKDGNRKKSAGSLSVGTFASKALIEGPIKNGSYMFAARRSTLEPLLAALENTIDNVPAFYFYDTNGKINWSTDPNNKFSVSYYAGKDNVDIPFLDDANFQLEYGNTTTSTNWTHLFGDASFLNVTGTYSYYFSNPVANLAGTTFSRSNNVSDLSLKVDFEYLPNAKHSIETGVWGGALLLRVADQFDGDESFSSRIQSNYIAAYLQDTWRPTEQWKITGGLRLNGFENGNYLRLEPRLSAEYFVPGTRTRLQAAVGRYTQFLTLITNEAFSGFDLWLTVDEGIQPASGDQFILGVKSGFGLKWDIELEGYYRTMEDLFELDPFIADAAGLDYADLFRVGEGYAYGLEFTLRKNVGKLNGFIGYNYAVVRRKFPTFNNGNFYPPRYDRLNDFNIVTNYQLSKRWALTSVFSYYTGQAFTKPLGRTAAFDLPFQNTPADVIIPGKVNANRLPAYHRLDVGFTYKKSSGFFGLGNNPEWKFQIINVYNRKNIWFNQLDLDENPGVLTQVQQLPLLPNISYSVQF